MKTLEYNIEPLAAVLLAIAGLLGAFILLQVATFFVTAADADYVVAGALSPAVGKPAITTSTEIKTVLEGLKKNNLFAPPAPKQYPISEVIGILGNEALINGQWHKAGDTVAGAKILAIEPTKVKVVWNGQKKEFMPIGSTGGGGPQGPGPGRRGGSPSPPGAPMVVTSAGPGSASSGAIAGRPSEERDEMKELKERWKNMTPEERQRNREEVRSRLSRRDR